MVESTGRIGAVAVLLGVSALGLAIIPRAILGVPPPWPEAPVAEPTEIVEGGKTFEWKGAKVTVGGTTKVVYPPAPPPPSTASKTVFVLTALVALVGIATALIAAWRERSYVLGGPAVALCTIALLWHYILIGVAVGIALVAIVIILAAFANSLSV